MSLYTGIQLPFDHELGAMPAPLHTPRGPLVEAEIDAMVVNWPDGDNSVVLAPWAFFRPEQEA